MESNVLSTQLSASGAVKAIRGRVRSLQYVASGSAGTITLKDGGSGGTTLCIINTPASATWQALIEIPDDGLLFKTDIYCTISNVSFVTVFYT